MTESARGREAVHASPRTMRNPMRSLIPAPATPNGEAEEHRAAKTIAPQNAIKATGRRITGQSSLLAPGDEPGPTDRLDDAPIGATATQRDQRHRARVSHHVCMDIAAAVILVLLVLVPVVVVIVLFVWAARKDGQADRAVQARLGIRRRTRLGR